MYLRNALLSADSDGQVLSPALWRPHRLALCLYMFRGVILRSAGLQDSRTALGGLMRGADKGAGAAPRAGLGWQARRGRELPLAGHGPAPAAALLRARWPEGAQMPQAGGRSRSALASGLPGALAGQSTQGTVHGKEKVYGSIP